MAWRTCIACRKVEHKADLLRITLQDQSVQLDLLNKLPGRGAYVHRDANCLAKAAERKLLGFRFRHKGGTIEVGELLNLQHELQTRLNLDLN